MKYGNIVVPEHYQAIFRDTRTARDFAKNKQCVSNLIIIPEYQVISSHSRFLSNNCSSKHNDQKKSQEHKNLLVAIYKTDAYAK